MYKIKQIPEDFIVEEVSNIIIKDKGEYTYLLLEKKDFDTEKAILKIADYFKLHRKHIGYAGNKDRHAITRQYISVRGNIKSHDFNDFKISVIGQGDRPISLGDLSENKFTITVRDILKKPETIEKTINYFDEQRFGRNNIEIGLSIIKNDFKKAGELIDYPETIDYLKKFPNDNINAIRKVPFKTQTMYIHAVQSWLWNEAAGEYVKKKTKKFSGIKYSHGTFVFPEGEIKDIEIPLLSFDTEFKNKDIKNIYETVLEKNKLTLRDFIIRQLPDITPPGGERQLISEIKGLKISGLETDELSKGKKKITLSFMLGKGSYATIAIKNMLKK